MLCNVIHRNTSARHDVVGCRRAVPYWHCSCVVPMTSMISPQTATSLYCANDVVIGIGQSKWRKAIDLALVHFWLDCSNSIIWSSGDIVLCTEKALLSHKDQTAYCISWILVKCCTSIRKIAFTALHRRMSLNGTQMIRNYVYLAPPLGMTLLEFHQDQLGADQPRGATWHIRCISHNRKRKCAENNYKL